MDEYIEQGDVIGMTLYFIGLGLSSKHLTMEAIEAIRSVDKIIIDTYTSIIYDFSPERISSINPNAELVLARRRDLEGRSISKIVEEAKTKNIAILVPGDPFIATTHDAIRLEALEKKVDIRIIHGISIYSVAASATGLQMYRFGKTVTLVYPEAFKPYSTIETIYDNLSRNLHTLVLLDLKLEENKAMTIREAINILLELDEENMLADVIGVGLSRAGTPLQTIHADILSEIKKYEYPGPPECIIVVAKPHPLELDALRLIGGLPDTVINKINDIYSKLFSIRRRSS